IERAQFFESLLADRPVEWQDLRARRSPEPGEGEAYYLCVGVHRAPDSSSLADFLHFLGSRLVFLIDWNKARKRLRAVLPKKDGIALLRWAADHDHGHRALLELGGDQLVFEAIETASRAPLHHGQPLSEMLGREDAMRYLMFALKTAAEGLLGGRSER